MMMTLTPILERYRETLNTDPASKVFVPYAEGLRALGKPQDAVKVLKKGLQFHPQHISAHIVLASIYFDKRLFKEVYEALLPWVDSTRDNLKLQKIFAESCLELGLIHEALKTFKYLLYLNPKDVELQTRVFDLEQQAQEPVIDTSSAENNFLYPLERLEDEKNISDEDMLLGWRDEVLVNHYHAQENTKDDSVDEWMEDSSSKTTQQQLFTSSVPQVAFDESANEQFEEEFDLLPTRTLAEIYKQQGLEDKAAKILKKIDTAPRKDEARLSVVTESITTTPHDRIEQRFHHFLKTVHRHSQLRK